MKLPLKILYISPEVTPFTHVSSLADVAAALPKSLQEQGHDIRVMMPKYGWVNERKYTLREVIRLKHIAVNIDGKEIIGSVKSAFIPDSKVQVYFLEHPQYFGRRGSPPNFEKLEDNPARFIFFCKGVLETLKLLHWQPNVIHCNDWQTALIPLLLNKVYHNEELFSKTATLLTLYNFHKQGAFSGNVLPLLGVENNDSEVKEKISLSSKTNFLKSGIEYADALSVASSTFAKELLNNPDLSHGLSDALSQRKNTLFGIVSGVDAGEWNPKSDSLIPKQYSTSDVKGKTNNRTALFEHHGIEDNGAPVLCVISELTEGNGFDLLSDALDDLLKLNVKLFIMGNGNAKFKKILQSAQKKCPDQIRVDITHDQKLAHLMIAGSDMILMLSKQDACTGYQMNSLVYGTIPVVHATGSLVDTIIPYKQSDGTGNGFVIDQYKDKELIKALKQALKIYNDEKAWSKLVKNAMKSNFSWKNAASKYVKLYSKLELAKRK